MSGSMGFSFLGNTSETHKANERRESEELRYKKKPPFVRVAFWKVRALTCILLGRILNTENAPDATSTPDLE